MGMQHMREHTTLLTQGDRGLPYELESLGKEHLYLHVVAGFEGGLEGKMNAIDD